MSRPERNALAILLVTLPVTVFAIRGELAIATAISVVGLAAVYARHLVVLGGALAAAAAMLLAPIALVIAVMVASFLAMCYFGVIREATLGSTSTGATGYGWGFDGGWGGGDGGGGDGGGDGGGC
jgi:uncharacterized membrane protein YgcG